LILLIALLTVSSCKFPDVELNFLTPEEGTARVFIRSEDNTEFIDSGREIPIIEMRDYICLSPGDFQKWTRYYQRQCDSNAN
jgi:hypothetical protein